MYGQSVGLVKENQSNVIHPCVLIYTYDTTYQSNTTVLLHKKLLYVIKTVVFDMLYCIQGYSK